MLKKTQPFFPPSLNEFVSTLVFIASLSGGKEDFSFAFTQL